MILLPSPGESQRLQTWPELGNFLQLLCWEGEKVLKMRGVGEKRRWEEGVQENWVMKREEVVLLGGTKSPMNAL